MSKFVKELITKQFTKDFDGVEECVLVDVIGLDVNETVILRAQLREKIFSFESSKRAWQLELLLGHA